VQQEVTRIRGEAHRQLIDDVIAARQTLLEAAARLRDLNEMEPECMTSIRMYVPGASDEERLCRLIIHSVRTRLEDQPDEATIVVGRLEMELRHHFPNPQEEP
jgi:hypothetical protein